MTEEERKAWCWILALGAACIWVAVIALILCSQDALKPLKHMTGLDTSVDGLTASDIPIHGPNIGGPGKHVTFLAPRTDEPIRISEFGHDVQPSNTSGDINVAITDAGYTTDYQNEKGQSQ
jgi:hypothetical protein